MYSYAEPEGDLSMDSPRVTRLRPGGRLVVVASSLAAVATLLLPNVALAADTTIGAAGGTQVCQPDSDTVQMTSTAPTSYTVPAGGGSITSWSAQFAGPAGGVR